MRMLVLALAIAASGCAAQPPQAAAPGTVRNRCSPAPAFAEGAERATLWIRTSSEFRAAGETVYRAATAALADGLVDPAWTAEPAQIGDLESFPPAVIMDIDETVLDNSAPQARMLLDETCLAEFDAVWDAWVAERSAPAVPGAAEFIRAARHMKDRLGQPVQVFFITNRECRRRAGDDSACPQQDDTAANLRALGLDAPTLVDDLMFKGERADWGSEKLSRRLEIASTHRIVLNVGDDFGDFLPAVRRQSVPERERARCANGARWGRQWFMIPNPMYGSWLVALGPDLEAALEATPQVIENCDTP
ncbi:MAG: 5'-nucleotidase, lipoprotein e(P4) family [Steroidobacteraceae bacterium]